MSKKLHISRLVTQWWPNH